MKTPMNFFATTPKGLELLLVNELKQLGATSASEKLAGVTFSGDLTLAYRVCLWSRLANRIILPLAKVAAATPEELYAGVQTINWDEHLDPTSTLAVHFVCSQSNITHSLFATQKVKDAVVDQFRDKYGIRPSVAREHPAISIYVYLHRNEATISLDLSGDSLHKRNYREAAGQAPLKENLAAAMLLRANWPAIAKAGGTLLDPMCGSGTLLIEAAMIAADVAPGLLRDYYGFMGWKHHQPKIWQTLLAEAQRRYFSGLASLPTIVGYDNDPAVIHTAFENIENAGFKGKIHVEKRDLSMFAPKPKEKPGLIIVNPPYGERLGTIKSLQPLYGEMGDKLKAAFVGWKAAILMGNPDLGKKMGLRAKRYYTLYNGPIVCKLCLFDIEQAYFVDRNPAAENERRIRAAHRALDEQPLEGQHPQSLQGFVSKLRTNLQFLRHKIQTQNVSSYRIYDADLPEYAFAIDLTDQAVQVQEYIAPKSSDIKVVKRRRHEVLAILPEVLNLPAAQIFFCLIPRPRKPNKSNFSSRNNTGARGGPQRNTRPRTAYGSRFQTRGSRV